MERNYTDNEQFAIQQFRDKLNIELKRQAMIMSILKMLKIDDKVLSLIPEIVIILAKDDNGKQILKEFDDLLNNGK